jgi:hypothetical protein
MFHVNVALFMTTRIAFMAYRSSLTGMRLLAFAPSEWLGCEVALKPDPTVNALTV